MANSEMGSDAVTYDRSASARSQGPVRLAMFEGPLPGGSARTARLRGG